MAASDAVVIKQHLIDPEICIRCNTCEDSCPVGAITHDARNYVVNVDICEHCMACVPPCPTGAIDNWFTMPKANAYSTKDQFSWDELPAPLTDAEPPPQHRAGCPAAEPAGQRRPLLARRRSTRRPQRVLPPGGACLRQHLRTEEPDDGDRRRQHPGHRSRA
jgi:benzoyl-CoA 2,3-dioxygenase component A